MDNGYDTPAAIHGVNAFQDNYIWLIRKGQKVVVVDPGDAEPVLRVLDAHGLQLEAILLTHHHGDHVGGVKALLERAAVPVYGPASEVLPHCDFPMREADVVELPAVDLTLRVVDVPGHTAGHIAYHGAASGAPVLFCGDTLFASGCGRLFEGTAQQMHESLGKFSDLPDQTRVYCAHEYTLSNNRWALAVEPDNAALQDWAQRAIALRDAGKPTVPTLLSHERAVNPFLRTAEPAVIAAVCQYSGQSPSGGAGVFGALRAWKDEFR